eukprot:TRINITY_DN92110_c0_g1_i1.p1 TRINITY_DN92110_c0_g1~~TRINITY_DN92110_c0_g1_i1.p1  ORF type:complete len:749 (+),score=179.72 TRINITY_DN92110_c0_g1_i1:34-2247(+)
MEHKRLSLSPVRTEAEQDHGSEPKSPKTPVEPHSPSAQRRDTLASNRVNPEFGECSLFDALVVSPDALPLQLPGDKYLEETLVGMLGAPAGNTAPSKHWKVLQAALQGEVAAQTCALLAWVTMGHIFEIASEACTAELQRRLSKCWIRLEIDSKRVDGYKASKDWFQEALPAVFTQAVYRLLVDAFPPERQLLSQKHKELIEKITHIAHHEVAGFQENAYTGQMLRKRLFFSTVLEAPFLNQRESVESERRRERRALEEAQRKDTEQPPLAFGSGNIADVNEDQLEHVMAGRSKRMGIDGQRRGSMWVPYEGSANSLVGANLSAAAKQSLSAMKRRAEEELSVDRYEALALGAEDLITRQLSQLYAEGSWEPGNTPPELASKPSESPSRLLTVSASRVQSPEQEKASAAALGMTVGRGSIAGRTDGTAAARRERERREAEQAERRRRDELLESRISAELPEVFSKRSLDTSFVSPALDRMAPSHGERQLLPGVPSNKQQVRMAEPKSQFLPSIDAGSSSRRQQTSEQPNRQKQKDAKSSDRRRPKPQPMRKKVSLDEQRSSKTSLLGQSRDRLPSDSLPRIPGTVVIPVEPESIKPQVIAQRLQQQMDAFIAQSFDHNKKDHDVLTGQKKHRLCPVDLDKEETAYIAKMESLVGSRSTPALHHSSPFGMKGSQTMRSRGPPGSTLGGSSSAAVLGSTAGAAGKMDAKGGSEKASSSPQAKKAWNELTVVNVLGTNNR